MTESTDFVRGFLNFAGEHAGVETPDARSDEDGSAQHDGLHLAADETSESLLGNVDIDPEYQTSLPAVEAPKGENVRLVGTIIKSFIGSGVLFLPKAFSNGGWLFSVLAMISMALISTLCILRLVQCRQVVIGSFGYVGYKVFGRAGQIAVDVSLVLSQAGFCCVYVVFIARNVLQLLNTNSCWLDGSWLWLLILLEWPLFTPLTWVRRIKYFGATNIAADVLIGGGLLGILAWSIQGMINQSHAGVGISVPAFNSQSFSLMLGTAVYAFEGVGMVVPVYDSLSLPGQKRFGTTLSITLAGIAAVYTTIGLVPYLFLQGMASTPMQDSVTLNLPRVWWAYLIQAGYCLALTFSYPLMLFPAVKILEKAAMPWITWAHSSAARGSSKAGDRLADHAHADGDINGDGAVSAAGATIAKPGALKWRKNVFRGVVVAVTLLIAYVGSEQLDNFVSLVGCFCCTPLAFIYPCWFHLKLIGGKRKLSLWEKFSDVAIIIFGCGVLVFSTYEAIAGWSIATIDPCVHLKTGTG